MAKIATEKMSFDGAEKKELEFKFDTNVTKEGIFTTTLPAEIAKIFMDAGIRLQRNQLKNYGYFSDSTYDGLLKQVREIGKEYMSRELVSEKTVIRYSISTSCAYCLDIDGKIVPNGQFQWTKTEDYSWKNGTLVQHAAQPRPFGFQIFAKPFIRKDYKYRSGKTVTEYDMLTSFGGSRVKKDQQWLQWLEAVCSMDEPNDEIKEIEYNEYVAKFFVDMIKSICMINEKIKDFIEPESIKKIAESGGKFLGA